MTKVLNLRQGAKKEVAKVSKKILERDKTSSIVSEEIARPQPLVQKRPVQIVWEAPSFYFNPQKRYLSLIIIALATGGGGMIFFSRDKLTAIFLLLSSLVLILYSTKRPEMTKIILDQGKISIGELAYYHKDLKSFWIHYEPYDIKELSLESKKWYMPYIKVSIEDNDPKIIRSILVNFVPEKEHEQSVIDIISRKLGL